MNFIFFGGKEEITILAKCPSSNRHSADNDQSKFASILFTLWHCCISLLQWLWPYYNNNGPTHYCVLFFPFFVFLLHLSFILLLHSIWNKLHIYDLSVTCPLAEPSPPPSLQGQWVCPQSSFYSITCCKEENNTDTNSDYLCAPTAVKPSDPWNTSVCQHSAKMHIRTSQTSGDNMTIVHRAENFFNGTSLVGRIITSTQFVLKLYHILN